VNLPFAIAQQPNKTGGNNDHSAGTGGALSIVRNVVGQFVHAVGLPQVMTRERHPR